MAPAITRSFLLIISISFVACSGSRSSSNKYTIRDNDGHRYEVLKMPDGKDWTTRNISSDLPESFCYNDSVSNCDRYGRLYSWKTAMTVCSQFGEGWRLPTKDEWQALAKQYGGIFGDSNDNGKAAYVALTDGGASQFNALLSGGSDPESGYKGMDHHGFYWTSTETNDSTAWFGNFGLGRPAFYIQNDGEKFRAFAVRCVKE